MSELTRPYDLLRMPAYVAVDVSESMGKREGDARSPWEAVNDGLQMISDSLLVHDPELRDLCALGVVTFNDEFNPHRSIFQENNAANIDPLPEPRGQTDFKILFEGLNELITEDLEQFPSRSWATKRPAVFILTDGIPYLGEGPQPPEAYLPAVRALHAKQVPTPRGPRSIAVVPFGFGDAQESTLCVLKSPDQPAYIAPANATGTIVDAIMKAILNSIVASASASDVVVRPPRGARIVNCTGR